MAPHVAHLARKKMTSSDFIGPRNYHYWLGEKPPPEMVEALKKGVQYVPRPRTDNLVRGKS